MSPLIQSYVAAAVRWIITLGVGYAIKHGADAAQANGVAAGFNVESISAAVVGIGTIVWSLVHKKSVATGSNPAIGTTPPQTLTTPKAP